MAAELSRMTSEEYQEDVLDHMEFMEVSISLLSTPVHPRLTSPKSQTLPDVQSMDIQTEIQWCMRPHLFDFLVESHAAFGLLPETLYLAINILDRYCSKRVVYRRHYQLVGCAALLIAAKYGDRKERVPTIKELKGMCCGLFDDEMYTQMEWHILVTLDWAVGHPTINSFLQIVLSEVAYDPEVEHMAWYLCEMALYHREFVSVRPSVMARSAVSLARCILSRPPPNQSEWSATYDFGVVVDLSNKLSSPSQVVYKKYASAQLSSVSRTLDAFLQQQASIARHLAPPTPPVEAPHMNLSMPSHSMPHTPAKSQYLPPIQHGYMTPPITPDSEGYLTVPHGKLSINPPRLCSTSPSPLHNVQQHTQYPMHCTSSSTILPHYYGK